MQIVNFNMARLITRSLSRLANLKNNPLIETENQFMIKLSPDQFAMVTFQKINDNAYDLLHSSIPEEYKGLGLGSILAERVFEYLAKGNKRYKVTCEFLQKKFEENRKRYEANVIE